MEALRRRAVVGVAFLQGALLLCSSSLEARSCRVNLVPNGTKFQCLTCHIGAGGGARNLFGADVHAIVLTSSCQTTFWGPELAAKDSDGDGRPNGEELLDLAGSWKPGEPRPGEANLVTQPGVPDFPPPLLNAVEPGQAARDGVTVINIRGTNFRAATQIRIGRHALLAPQFISAELIAGTAPPLGISEPGGAKDVIAIDGAARSTLRAAVTYPDLPPLVLAAVDPREVLPDGTTAVTVSGENFLADTKIRIGGRELGNAAAPSADQKTISGLAPALGAAEALGPRDVTATDGRGRVTLAAGVTYVEAALGPRFIRGDATGDGGVDLADATGTLTALFKGGARLDCSAAADANEDRKVDLADAVFLLIFLFQGGAAPALPHPDCGAGTEGDLGCERSCS